MQHEKGQTPTQTDIATTRKNRPKGRFFEKKEKEKAKEKAKEKEKEQGRKRRWRKQRRIKRRRRKLSHHYRQESPSLLCSNYRPGMEEVQLLKENQKKKHIDILIFNLFWFTWPPVGRDNPH